ncbi:alkaline phosphatase [Sphingomonas sp. dw_22]|uniref:alkaline phosphatase n=1 Tax=Sphingomonas sp. dw_22 TaxID=2721175 RepID=UPI00211602B9|nr:alkaline phosphatase [Sphingomonas sp. dw_22]
MSRSIERFGRLLGRLAKGGRSALALAPAMALLCASTPVEARPARNVILFLGDAGGLPTLSAAGIYAHNRPQSLFIQSMPHIGLSDTSALNHWVTDSAAGMTAIVTGHKTNSGMNSVVPSVGGTGVTPVKTILEYAEQRGLSTGVITNMPIWDATPAACYAHVASRTDKDEIFRQLLAPRYGDGVDILIGKDRAAAEAAYAKMGTNAAQAFTRAGYLFSDDPLALTPETRRAAILRDEDFAPIPAVEATIASLSRNRKGYFLMVEWDMHTNKLQDGLRHAVEMDDMIRKVSASVGKDTLILFVADHSYDLKLLSGTRDRPLAEQLSAPQGSRPVIAADSKGAHAGEEVVAAAMGPGAEGVKGFFSNTWLFDVMMTAFGWKVS